MKELLKTKWVSVIETSNGFQYFQRKGKDSIALFLLKQENDKLKVLVRFQPLPLDNNPDLYAQKLYPCPITGGMYEGNDPKTTAIHEAKEEAGYDIENEIKYLGKYVTSTQSSEIVYMFYADVTELTQEEPKGDGTEFEKISNNEWRDFLDLKNFDYSACKIGFSMLLDKLN